MTKVPLVLLVVPKRDTGVFFRCYRVHGLSRASSVLQYVEPPHCFFGEKSIVDKVTSEPVEESGLWYPYDSGYHLCHAHTGLEGGALRGASGANVKFVVPPQGATNGAIIRFEGLPTPQPISAA